METQIEHREKKDAQALRLFIENKDCWLTAIQINRCINSSDARKIISNLIRKGYPIEKKTIDKANGTKLYRLVAPYRKMPKQITLF